MNWLFVFIAGLLEVVWASGLKHAETGFQWALTFILILVSFILLIYSYKSLPIAAAYTVFVGMGTVGTYLVGIILGDSFSIKQLVFLAILLVGIIGMKVFTRKETYEARGEK
jgi:paired small multidrug resistance pump